MKSISCFVIMPFNANFDDVYKKHIKPLIQEQLVSVECVRIDEKLNLSCSIVANIKKRNSTLHICYRRYNWTQPQCVL